MNPEPSPEQLAAFLDGELNPADAARAADWLHDHPDAAEEVEGQRALLRLWREYAPPEPTPAAWDAALARVRAGLPVGRPRTRRLPRVTYAVAGLAAAAAVAALLWVRPAPHAGPAADDGPLPVVAPGDVTVLGVDARDADGLVVAAPPVGGPIVLANQDDVSVVRLTPYRDDGPVPDIGEGDVPLIVAASPVAGR